ncbi:MAG: division/cell wall cluster transcriptional repressor MraZ [Lachnospiraceae bacterium]|nr:division/cell wall cluster transcriptional repressor MraZ [Lachnospiraceae bacterium]
MTGEYHHSLDTKGRLIVPARFRDVLGSTFRIGVSLDNCLTVYTDAGWDAFYEKLMALPQNRPDARKLVRYFTAGTFDVELDRQGRILLPQKAREKASIDKDVVFIGYGDKAEIWSEEVYDEYMSTDSREEAGRIASSLQDENFMI